MADKTLCLGLSLAEGIEESVDDCPLREQCYRASKEVWKAVDEWTLLGYRAYVAYKGIPYDKATGTCKAFVEGGGEVSRKKTRVCRTRRKRRASKAATKNGKCAAPSHKSKSGRSGSVFTRHLKSRKEA